MCCIKIIIGIASLFEGAIINAIEGSINDVACEELESIGEEFLSDVVTQVGDLLENLLPENTPPVDFLFPEKNMTVPEGMELLDYSTLGSESGNWLKTSCLSVW